MSVKRFFYILIQCSWGLIQTLSGLALFLYHVRDRHYMYHGAIVTEVNTHLSVSLGLFVFVTTRPISDRRTDGRIPDDEIHRRLLVHEYGHTIQSLILGPLYLPVMGIPSAAWASLPFCVRLHAHDKSYYRFYTERLANFFGEKVTGEKSMGNALL